ncbi:MULTISPECIES: nuclear transport factor 2 family protein [Ferrimonas]|uniref:YybH family protein n=1 Tax=Ferrimonas TaxID=44011 RepID=UPI00041C6126|nr:MULTISPECIES: nuclear transport factor 2 family protein [Ferrimonas]USD39306.1 DUF4440 domain-containing protein [Ferrimonas sp. SCSIO 43195]
MRVFSLLLALLLAGPVSAQEDVNGAINRIYDEISAAYNSLDSDTLTGYYSDNACLISASKEEGLLNGRMEIADGLAHWFKKIEKRGAELKVHYRVVNRQISGDTITDAGYYLVVYTPDHSTEQPSSEFVGKFIMSFQQDQDKQWRIISDSANRTRVDRFTDAQRQKGLYYKEYSPSALPQQANSK